jgi:CheY-like chemotaxis protein
MDSAYCPSCDQDAPVERSLQGAYVLLGCELCGLGLGIKPATTDVIRRMKAAGEVGDRVSTGRVNLLKREMASPPAAKTPVPTAPSDGQVPTAPKANLRKMKRVFIVEDANLLRRIVKDLLSERNLFDEVIDCDDGDSFIEAYAKSLADGVRPGLVVLDINMPRLDGIDAALAMRAIETAMNIKRRTPILFFTTRVSDESFKAFLRDIGSARYIRKGEDGDSERLGSRLLTVLERLMAG